MEAVYGEMLYAAVALGGTSLSFFEDFGDKESRKAWQWWAATYRLLKAEGTGNLRTGKKIKHQLATRGTQVLENKLDVEEAMLKD